VKVTDLFKKKRSFFQTQAVRIYLDTCSGNLCRLIKMFLPFKEYAVKITVFIEASSVPNNDQTSAIINQYNKNLSQMR